jgi:DNA-binding MarR family transcriptional regulator
MAERRRHDLLALLMPVSRELRRVEEAAAAAHGVSMWQYAILGAVGHRPGRNQLAVAGALGYSKNRLVGDLDHLERSGLLTRTPGTDRRANVLATTPAGRQVAAAVQREIHRREDELLAPLSPAARRALFAALEALQEPLRTRRTAAGD